MTRLPTAKELNLWDYDPGEGMVLSVYPPAQEYLFDPMWYDMGGRDPFDQRFIFRQDPGSQRTEKIREIIEDYPRYGPKMYEKCAEAGRVDLLRELLNLGASMDIAEAKRRRDDLADNEFDENVPTVSMMAPIVLAAWEGHFNAVQFLVEEANVDINVKDSNGGTALTHAAVRGYIKIVNFLLDRGAQITFEREGLNDYEAAIKSGNVPAIQRILQDQQTATSQHKMTFEHVRVSSFSGSTEMVEFLLDVIGFPQPPMKSADYTGEPPYLTDEQRLGVIECLMGATQSGGYEMLSLFLSYITKRRADGSFEYVDIEEGYRANIFNATEDAMEGAHDDPKTFQLAWDSLLCPPNETQCDFLNRRLISACTEGCPKIAKLLVEKYGADVNWISHKYFTTPLGRAAGSGQMSLSARLLVAEYLLSRPEIDIHLANGDFCNGTTPMSLAIREGQTQVEMVKLLLKHGGPVEEFDATIIEQAKSFDSNEVMPVYVVCHNQEPRRPVRLMTEEGYSSVKAGNNTQMVKLELKARDVIELLLNLQIRKRDSVLAANDPGKRPVKTRPDAAEEEEQTHQQPTEQSR